MTHSPTTTRRDFLRGAARKAAYVVPAAVILGPGAEARANSNDDIPWSQCASQGESCAGGPCCPEYMCVSVNGMERCEPDINPGP